MIALENNQFTIAPDARGRLFAFGRFLLFCVIFCVALVIGGVGIALVHFVFSSKYLPTFSSPVGLVEGEVCMAIAALCTTMVMCALEKRPFGSCGLGGKSKLRFWSYGAGAGLILLSVLLVVLRLFTGFRFGHISERVSQILYYGAMYSALFVTVAVSEETTFRGYALVSLSQAISFWPAAILLSAIFGAFHAFNASENTWGLVSVGAYGMVMSYSFLRTGSLWFAIGLHASWDFAQSFIFGVPDSGVVLPGAMLRASVRGPAWLTGGGVGPEGSILMVLVLLIQVGVIWTIGRQFSDEAVRS